MENTEHKEPYVRKYDGSALLKYTKLSDKDYEVQQVLVINGIPYLEVLRNNVRVSITKLVKSKTK